jgi:hypothetical protein
MTPAADDPREPSRPSGVAATSPRGARFKSRRNGDVLVALLFLWVASAVRVVGAAMRHEIFGTEATLALMSLVLVPCGFFRARPRTELRRSSDPTRPVLRLVEREPAARTPPTKGVKSGPRG